MTRPLSAGLSIDVRSWPFVSCHRRDMYFVRVPGRFGKQSPAGPQKRLTAWAPGSASALGDRIPTVPPILGDGETAQPVWLLVELRDDGGDRPHRASLPQTHDPNTLGVSAGPSNLGGRNPDDLPIVGDDQEVLVLADGKGSGQLAHPGRQHRRLHAQTAPTLLRVLLERRSLPIPVVGDREQAITLAGGHHGDHLITLPQLHADDSGGGPAHWSDPAFRE